MDEIAKYLVNQYRLYKADVQYRNDNRRYGMGDPELTPTFDGFMEWLKGY